MSYVKARRMLTAIVLCLAITFVIGPMGARLLGVLFWLFVTPTLDRYVRVLRDGEGAGSW